MTEEEIRRDEKIIYSLWTLPDGTQVETANAECPECGHAHEAMMGGICVGCPCSAQQKMQHRKRKMP